MLDGKQVFCESSTHFLILNQIIILDGVNAEVHKCQKVTQEV